MSPGSLVVCVVGGVVAVVNAVTMRRLWASPIFERPQKLAQSVLIWLIPGSVFIVRRVLGDHLPRRSLRSADSTMENISEEFGADHENSFWHAGHDTVGGAESGGEGGGGGGD